MALRQIQESAGAVLDSEGIALSFGNDDQALEAINTGVAIGDRFCQLSTATSTKVSPA